MASEVSEDASTALTTTTTSQEVAAPAPERKVKKIIRKKRRPARVQIDPSEVTSEPPPQTGTIFNIWYNKWAHGDRETGSASQTAAKGRCNIQRDSGYTKADGIKGSYICLFFARGLCHKGPECEYLHRLPAVYDIWNPNVDCFGRDKFSDYRDDMGGVGSMLRQNRTIYVGRIHVTDDIEEIVARHFSEWGEVERIRVLNTRGVGFITYKYESNAQFAKEAMAHQSLDHEEVLNVRWATADPNPLAQKREARRIEEQAAEAIRRALPAEFVAEIEGLDPEARKRRKIESSFGLQDYEAPDDVYYARGANAVTAAGRQDFALEDEQRLLIENGQAGQEDGEGQGQLVEAQQQEESGGIFSSRTLAALKSVQAAVTTGKSTELKSSGPLVAYDSDDDDDD